VTHVSERAFTSKSFSEFLGEGKIMGARCGGCGKLILPPRPICPGCGGKDLEWKEFKGRGAIRAFTVINVPLTRMKGACPYACGVVALDEGPSITGQILGVQDGGQVTVGARVEPELVREGDKTKLCFRPL